MLLSTTGQCSGHLKQAVILFGRELAPSGCNCVAGSRATRGPAGSIGEFLRNVGIGSNGGFASVRGVPPDSTLFPAMNPVRGPIHPDLKHPPRQRLRASTPRVCAHRPRARLAAHRKTTCGGHTCRLPSAAPADAPERRLHLNAGNVRRSAARGHLDRRASRRGSRV
jgi:hypothetical protein